jgi:hypothetical protein
LLITLILKYTLITNSNLEGSISTIKGFLIVLGESFFSGNSINILPSDHFIQKDIFLNRVLNAVSNLSFYLYIKKFVSGVTIALTISLFFSSITIISLLTNMRNNLKNFSLLSLIFLFFSCVFIFILPMFEYSYLLPSTFLIIIFNFILFKKIFKKKTYSFLSLFLILITFFFIGVFSGLIKFKNIEIYSYRSYVKRIINLSKSIDTKNSLIYFNEENPSMPEIYRWYLKVPVCNFSLSYINCASLRKIDKVNKVYIIATETKGAKFNKKFLNNNYQVKDKVVNSEGTHEYYYILDDK